MELLVVALILYTDALSLLLKKYSGLKQLQLALCHGTKEKQQQHMKLAQLPHALGSWK